MKKLALIVFFLSGIAALKAQQDILVSQYMFNHLLLNPAYAGTKEYLSSTLLYRKQWAGWGKGAPETQIATIHAPLGLTNFGWGVNLSHDHLGVQDRTDAFLNASYHIRVSPKYQLSVGMRAGGAYYSYNNSELNYWDENDPAFEGHTTKFLPNVGAGAFLYSDKMYVGLSTPTIISYDPSTLLPVKYSADGQDPRQVRHHYLTAGYVYELNPDVIFKPSILLKYVWGAPAEADFNLNVLLANTIWVGASYRTGDCVVAILELQLSRKLRLGYSYDITTTDVKNYSSGSHEIMLGYDFGYDIMKIKTPRYF